MTKLSKHFDDSEFKCRCCEQLHPGGIMPPPQLLEFLEDIREHFTGLPVHINSGYRCPKHNAAVGGASASRHMIGDAADLWIEGISPVAVYKYADTIVAHSGGVGEYATFTHIDVRGHKARW